MNRAIITSALSLTLVGPSTARASQTYREQSEVVEDVGDMEGLRVENSRGLIRVRRGEGPTLRLTALKIARGEDRMAAMKFARATRVVTSREAGRFVVRVRYPQRQALHVSFWDLFSGFEFPRIEVRLELEVPGDLPVSLGSTSGDLETEMLDARQTLATTSGDVTVHDAGGAIDATSTSGDIVVSGLTSARLRTVSGDVQVEHPKGALTVQTTSGEIVVEGTPDSLSAGTVSGGIHADGATRGMTVQTTSGDIVIGRTRGGVRAESSSGDIRLGLREPFRGAEVTTASGDIDVEVGPAVDCAIDVRTSSGVLDVSVPLEVGSVSRRVVTGTVRNGRAPVRLRSSSGDIAVRGGGK